MTHLPTMKTRSGHVVSRGCYNKRGYRTENVKRAIFECTECGMAFISRHRLRYHRESKHSDRTFPCPVPGCTFISGSRESTYSHSRQCRKNREILLDSKEDPGAGIDTEREEDYEEYFNLEFLGDFDNLELIPQGHAFWENWSMDLVP